MQTEIAITVAEADHLLPTDTLTEMPILQFGIMVHGLTDTLHKQQLVRHTITLHQKEMCQTITKKRRPQHHVQEFVQITVFHPARQTLQETDHLFQQAHTPEDLRLLPQTVVIAVHQTRQPE